MRSVSGAVRYDTRSPVKEDKNIQTARARSIPEHTYSHTHTHTHYTLAYAHRQEASCLLSPSWGLRAELQVCLLSVFHLLWFKHTCTAFPQEHVCSQPLISKHFTIQTCTASLSCFDSISLFQFQLPKHDTVYCLDIQNMVQCQIEKH